MAAPAPRTSYRHVTQLLRACIAPGLSLEVLQLSFLSWDLLPYPVVHATQPKHTTQQKDLLLLPKRFDVGKSSEKSRI